MFNPNQVSPEFNKVLDEQNAAAVEEVTAAITPPAEEQEVHEAGDGHANEIHKAMSQIRDEEGENDDGVEYPEGPCLDGKDAAEEGDVSETETVGVVGGTDEREELVITDRDKDHADLKVFMNVPLVELVHKKREYEQSKEDIEFTVKAMQDMTNDPNGQQDLINQMNAMERLGLNFKTTDEFYAKYDELHAENVRILALLTEVITKIVPGERHSVAFLAHSMVEALNARVEAIEKDPAKMDTLRYRALVRTRDGYMHREEQDYLLRKIFVAHTIYKLCKDVYKEPPAASMKLIDKALSGIFNDKGMLRFRKILCNTMLAANQNGSSFGSKSRVEFLAFAFTYWLAKLLDEEARTGKAIQVRMFIMNVYDQADPTADYDLPGGPKLHLATVITLLQVFAYIEQSTNERTIRACCREVEATKAQILANYEEDKKRYLEETPGTDVSETSTTLIGTHPDETPEELSRIIEENLEQAREKQAAMDAGEFDEEDDDEGEDPGIIGADEDDGLAEEDPEHPPEADAPATDDFLPDEEVESATVDTGAKQFPYYPDYSPDDVDHGEDKEAVTNLPDPPAAPSPGIAN